MSVFTKESLQRLAAKDPAPLISSKNSKYLINIVAVDFDDTLNNGHFDTDVKLCTYEFNPTAIAILKEFQARGGKVILWTCRDGEHIDHALKALQKKTKFRPDYVNNNTKEIVEAFGDEKGGKKIYADLYIDDRNTIDRKVNWVEIADWLTKRKDSKANLSNVKPINKNMNDYHDALLKQAGVRYMSTTDDELESMINKARRLVTEYFNAHKNKSDSQPITIADTYVVWFSKALQNWKALISTAVSDGMYYELTYNGDKEETYLDAYKQFDNVVITDSMNHIDNNNIVWVINWVAITPNNPTGDLKKTKLFNDPKKLEDFCATLTKQGFMYEVEKYVIE